MSFIQRELDKISSELHKVHDTNPGLFNQLYAAQQALSWALEPQGFRSPFDTIMDIRSNSKDCSELFYPQQS